MKFGLLYEMETPRPWHDRSEYDVYQQALEQIETTAHRAACSFVDIFQEHLNKRVAEHNDYLDQAQKKFGIDLSRFIVFKA